MSPFSCAPRVRTCRHSTARDRYDLVLEEPEAHHRIAAVVEAVGAEVDVVSVPGRVAIEQLVLVRRAAALVLPPCRIEVVLRAAAREDRRPDPVENERRRSRRVRPGEDDVPVLAGLALLVAFRSSSKNPSSCTACAPAIQNNDASATSRIGAARNLRRRLLPVGPKICSVMPFPFICPNGARRGRLAAPSLYDLSLGVS